LADDRRTRWPRTATVGRRPRLGAALEMEDLIHNVRVELNRKGKIPICPSRCVET
jgi:hypothetical protein